MPFYFLNVGGECRALPTKVLMYSEMFKAFFEKDMYLNYFECDREGRILINEDPKLFYQLFDILNVMDSSITKDIEIALYNNNKKCGIEPMVNLATQLRITKLIRVTSSNSLFSSNPLIIELPKMFSNGKMSVIDMKSSIAEKGKATLKCTHSESSNSSNSYGRRW